MRHLAQQWRQAIERTAFQRLDQSRVVPIERGQVSLTLVELQGSPVAKRGILAETSVGGTEMGYLTWEYGGSRPPRVDHVEVHPPYRRQGLATAMWHFAQEVAPGIEHGMLLPDGEAWVQSLGSGSFRQAGLPSGLWWRVHPKERTFGPDDAISKPLYGGRFRDPDPGYSCVSHPWYVLAYCVAYGWVADRFVDDDDVLGFRGKPQGEGHDGETLVMPHSPTPEYRAPWDVFLVELESYPLPAMSSDLWARHGGLTWDIVGEHLALHNGSEPRYQPILERLGVLVGS